MKPDDIYTHDGRLKNFPLHDADCECGTCKGLRQLHDPNAAWRSKPATAFQLSTLRKRGIPHPKHVTRGTAADLLKRA